MGTSTDAILAWGFCAPWEPGEAPWEKEEDLEVGEWIAAKHGLKAPTEPYTDPYQGGDPNVSGLYEAYWAKSRDLLKELGVEFKIHCSYDYSMHVVTVSESVATAYRGDPVVFEKLEVSEGWDAKLRAFCEKVGIECPDPAWVLCSMWG